MLWSPVVGVFLGICFIAVIIFIIKRRQRAEQKRKIEEKQKQQNSLLSATGKEKEFLGLAKAFAKEEETISNPLLLEAILKILITSGSNAEATQLLAIALKKYPNQVQFSDLEIDLIVSKKLTDTNSVNRLWNGYLRCPERKNWLSRYVSVVFSTSNTSSTALKAVGEHYKSSGDLKALNYLGNNYEKKKLFNESSFPIFEELSKIDSQNAKWHYALARCRQNTGDLPGAEEALIKCLSIDKTFQNAIDLFNLLQKDKQTELAANSAVPAEKLSEIEIELPDRYVQITELGRGGMGVVYKAFDDTLKRWVAIKVLKDSDPSDTDKHKQRFLFESRALACLDHPTIPRVFDVSVNPPVYIALEFLEGTNFRDLLTSGNQISPVDFIRIARDLADGFQHACEHDVLHRDIKPENILMEKNGRIRILDFGLAKFLKSDTNLTQDGSLLGTFWYLAPERLNGESATIASEIFSFGVTLFEIFTGSHPFHGDTHFVIMFQEPKPLTQIRKDCPPELELLILECLSKNPANRPKDFKEIKNELDRLTEKIK
ncbi:MAG: protein kinase [Candidatus Riflebacteria bacterium]|nr:protein kinase [Candidatus Riflebacteria bacterium]